MSANITYSQLEREACKAAKLAKCAAQRAACLAALRGASVAKLHVGLANRGFSAGSPLFLSRSLHAPGFQHFLPVWTDYPSFTVIGRRLLTLLRLGVAQSPFFPRGLFYSTLRPFSNGRAGPEFQY